MNKVEKRLSGQKKCRVRQSEAGANVAGKLLACLPFLIVSLVLLVTGCGEPSATQTASPTATPTATQPQLSIAVTTPSGQTYSTPTVTVEGKTSPGASVTISGGKASVNTTADQNGRFSVAVGLAEGKNYLAAEARLGSERATATVVAATYQIDPATYKAQCQAIPFAQLNKNPDAYKGQKYVTKGQVIQVMESGNQTAMRINVTDEGYGLWTDTIYVEYAGATTAVEDSIVKIWGDVYGSYSYTSTAGWNVTVPGVIAKYVEVVG